MDHPLFIHSSISLLIAFDHCEISVDSIFVHPFLGCLFGLIDLYVYFKPISCCLDYCSFIVILETRNCEHYNFAIIILLFFWSFSFPY